MLGGHGVVDKPGMLSSYGVVGRPGMLGGPDAARSRQLMAAAVALVVVAALVAAVQLWPARRSNESPAAALVPASPPSSTSSPTPTSPPVPAPAESPFTGLPGPAGPVLVVKIDNVAAARPQRGLDAADLVYVEPVEAGLTRLAAVFSSRLPEVAGPVRSARESDLELLRQFGTPAFAYSGAAPPLLPVIESARVVPVSPAQAGPAYFRGPDRPRPHNLYARPGQLLGLAPGVTPAPDIGFRFGPAPAGGIPSQREVVRYQAAEYAFEWSAPESRWLVWLDGQPLLDAGGDMAGSAGGDMAGSAGGDMAGSAGGARLGTPTVVVQSVVVHPSQLSDVLGNVSPYAETVGSGAAVVLRDGATHACRWSRPSADLGTSFTTADGQPCDFARGPVWVLLVAA
jgi:hypothetical protein